MIGWSNQNFDVSESSEVPEYSSHRWILCRVTWFSWIWILLLTDHFGQMIPSCVSRKEDWLCSPHWITLNNSQVSIIFLRKLYHFLRQLNPNYISRLELVKMRDVFIYNWNIYFLFWAFWTIFWLDRYTYRNKHFFRLFHTIRPDLNICWQEFLTFSILMKQIILWDFGYNNKWWNVQWFKILNRFWVILIWSLVVSKYTSLTIWVFFKTHNLSEKGRSFNFNKIGITKIQGVQDSKVIFELIISLT